MNTNISKQNNTLSKPGEQPKPKNNQQNKPIIKM